MYIKKGLSFWNSICVIHRPCGIGFHKSPRSFFFLASVYYPEVSEVQESTQGDKSVFLHRDSVGVTSRSHQGRKVYFVYLPPRNHVYIFSSVSTHPQLRSWNALSDILFNMYLAWFSGMFCFTKTAKFNADKTFYFLYTIWKEFLHVKKKIKKHLFKALKLYVSTS